VDLIRRVQQEALQSEPYHYLSLADIQTVADHSRALFDHVVAFESFPVDERGIEEIHQKMGLKIQDVEVFEQTHYPFTVHVIPEENLLIKFSFQPTDYTEEFVQNIANHFRQIVKQVIDCPTLSIQEIEVVSQAEKEQLM